LSTGSVDAICQRASEALAGPHLQLQDWVLDQQRDFRRHADGLGEQKTFGEHGLELTTAGVEPTNNPAERALRAPVIHRKIAVGTQSDSGERFAERALSAAATCRQQRRSLFTYLSELITAHSRGDPFPALT
jgi:Transposase IS66 family